MWVCLNWPTLTHVRPLSHSRRWDLLVGADGAGSAVRAALCARFPDAMQLKASERAGLGVCECASFKPIAQTCTCKHSVSLGAEHLGGYASLHVSLTGCRWELEAGVLE
jgi:2-polyprenyl-6-methoxyphenol hydroxylase-like FAD-dependent oxidoreductase